MLTLKPLYALPKKDLVKANMTLEGAFREDPIIKTMFQDRQSRIHYLWIMIKYCYRYGKIYSLDDQVKAVMMVTEGDNSAFNMRRLILSGGGVDLLYLDWKAFRNKKAFIETVEAAKAKAMAGKKWVYLQMIGVRPDQQGKGLFSRLMRALLRGADQGGYYLYLETETLRNVEIYEHFGFGLIEEIIIEKDLKMWLMTRPPQKVS